MFVEICGNVISKSSWFQFLLHFQLLPTDHWDNIMGGSSCVYVSGLSLRGTNYLPPPPALTNPLLVGAYKKTNSQLPIRSWNSKSGLYKRTIFMIRVLCVLVGRFIRAARSFDGRNSADVLCNLWSRVPHACLRVTPSNLETHRMYWNAYFCIESTFVFTFLAFGV